jgi:hypothetical protein
MPSPGLSLCAFLPQQPDAIVHLLNVCYPANPTLPALVAEWTAALALKGQAIPNAGHPNIQPIPNSHAAYITALRGKQWVDDQLKNWPTARFEMVEIDPLLAFQPMVDLNRVNHHCGAFTQPPTLDELFATCLPDTQTNEPVHFQGFPQSTILKARSLNLRTTEYGWFQGDEYVGIKIGYSLALVHVVQFNGRYYLHNGYHRAVGTRLAGATSMPCLVRDVGAFADVGQHVFPQTLLEGADPPTVGHFALNRAYPVQLRAHSRVLHVSWAEYIVPDE